MFDPPLAAGQRRFAIFDGRAMLVRLVRPAPDDASAWICAVQTDGTAIVPDGCDVSSNGDALLLVSKMDISLVLADEGDQSPKG